MCRGTRKTKVEISKIGTVTKELLGGAELEIYNAADPAERLKILCIDKNGIDVTTNETPVYKDWDDDNSNSPTNKKFISGYEVVGSAVINGSKDKKVSGITAYGNERYQGPGLSITEVKADTKITATFQHYELCYFWNIAGLQEEPVRYLEVVTENTDSAQQGVVDKSSGGESHTWSKGRWGYSAKYTAPLGYYIQSIDNNINYNDRISADKRTGETNSYSGGKGENTFYLAPYTASLAYTVDGVTTYMYVNDANAGDNYNAGGYNTEAKTWTYTVPTGKTVAPNGLTSNYCDAAYKGGKVTVSGLTANSTVSITTSTETPTEANTSYYMGDMSFEYVRNAAAFTWDGKTEGGGSWKPVNSFGWRHAVGSKSYEVGDETLTVDNGSILFVNTMQNTPVTYTVQLSNTDGKDYGVSLMFDESENIQVSNDGVATVTVQPGEQVTLVCRMTGTPDFSSGNEIEIGTITVTRK